jgi:hypothetical protein
LPELTLYVAAIILAGRKIVTYRSGEGGCSATLAADRRGNAGNSEIVDRSVMSGNACSMICADSCVASCLYEKGFLVQPKKEPSLRGGGGDLD